MTVERGWFTIVSVDVLIAVFMLAIVLVAHWRRVLERFAATGGLEPPPQRFRMSDRERLATLIGALVLISDVVVAAARGETPNGFVETTGAFLAIYLALDLYVRVRYSQRRQRR